MPRKSETLTSVADFKLGRKRPVARCPRLSLQNYLMRSLPAPPARCDYAGPAAAALSNRYGNDTLNDCVIAAIAHAVGVLTGNAGTAPFIYTSDQIVQLYSAISGYIPGNAATDVGCDEQTALNFWENNGAPVGAHGINGWVAVRSSDPTEYRTALWLFENLFIGMEVPDAWIHPKPTSSNFVWDEAGPSNPNNGHCVAGVGYTSGGVVISTWGLTGIMTDAAIFKYATQSAGGELYTVISQEGINKATKRAPSGFDWSQLVADFDSLGGTVWLPT